MSKRIVYFILGGLIGGVCGLLFGWIQIDDTKKDSLSYPSQSVSQTQTKQDSSSNNGGSRKYTQAELARIFKLDKTENTDVFFDETLGFGFAFNHRDYKIEPYTSDNRTPQLSEAYDATNSQIAVSSPNTLSYIAQYQEDASYANPRLYFKNEQKYRVAEEDFLHVFQKSPDTSLQTAVKNMFITEEYEDSCIVQDEERLNVQNDSIQTAVITTNLTKAEQKEAPNMKWGWLYEACPARARKFTDTYKVVFFAFERYPDTFFSLTTGVQTP
ncbi:MAG: hypothetical protein ABEI13_01995, partial [Candidatus Paceibacteria bacterium]